MALCRLRFQHITLLPVAHKRLLPLFAKPLAELQVRALKEVSYQLKICLPIFET